jgi:hypothetical protein
MKTTLATLGLLALVLAGAWRWQLAPWLAARAVREQPELARTVDTLVLALDAQPLARTRPILLRWQFDPTCTQVYELDIDETFAHEGVAPFLGRAPEHSRHRLTLAADPQRAERWLATLEPREVDPSNPARTRELHVAADRRAIGPRAPDLACRNRSWDVLEDALALGWPTLPESAPRAGERWIGDAVGGRCHETVCLDATGSFDPARSCQAMPWHESLAGFARDADGTTITLLRSHWHDDHEDETATIGITTTRELALAEGRLLLARAEVEQRWSGVIRQLELRRVDTCPLARRARAAP